MELSSPLLIDIVSARRCIIVSSYEGRRYDSGSLFGEKSALFTLTKYH